MYRLLFLFLLVFYLGCDKKENQKDVKEETSTQRQVLNQNEDKEFSISPQGTQSYISNNYIKWTVQGVWRSMGIRVPSEEDIKILHKLYREGDCGILVEIKGVEYLFIFVWKNGEWKYATYGTM